MREKIRIKKENGQIYLYFMGRKVKGDCNTLDEEEKRLKDKYYVVEVERE